jgi:serine/threonine protein kinase
VNESLDFASLVYDRPLGKGAFGEVGLYTFKEAYRLPDSEACGVVHTAVAVKMLLPEALQDESSVADFNREMEALKKLRHSCIVTMVGCGRLPDKRYFIALEYVPGGDLKTLIEVAHRAKTAGEPSVYANMDALRWMHDIARGLNYLHTRRPIIMHRGARQLAAGMGQRCR